MIPRSGRMAYETEWGWIPMTLQGLSGPNARLVPLGGGSDTHDGPLVFPIRVRSVGNIYTQIEAVGQACCAETAAVHVTR